MPFVTVAAVQVGLCTWRRVAPEVGVRVDLPRRDELSNSVHHHRPARGSNVAFGDGGCLRLEEQERAAADRHRGAQQGCHPANHDGRQSRSAGLMTSDEGTSGLHGRLRMLGCSDGFARHGRRMGSFSTAAKRCTQTKGEVASARQHGWAPMAGAAAPSRLRDVLAGVRGSARDSDNAGAPGQRPTRRGRSRKAVRSGVETSGVRIQHRGRAECRNERYVPLDGARVVARNGDLGHDTCPRRGLLARGDRRLHVASGRARGAARCGACVRSTGKALVMGMSLAPLGWRPGDGAQRSARRRAEHGAVHRTLFGPGQTWLRGAKPPGREWKLESGSTGRPSAP